MAENKTKFAKSVIINVIVALMALGAGFFLANRQYEQLRYLNSLELLNRIGYEPRGKLAPGTYYIPYGHGRHSILCRIVGSQAPGSLHEIDLGCGRPSTPTFLFTYQNHDNFHTPLVSLLTGHPGTDWIDVGLKGRFLLKNGPNGNSMTLLKGTWVPFERVLGNTFQYKGKYYRYDIASGDWHEIRKRVHGSLRLR